MLTYTQTHIDTDIYIQTHIHTDTHTYKHSYIQTYTFAYDYNSDRNSFVHELIEKRKSIMLKSSRKSISKKCKRQDP